MHMVLHAVFSSSDSPCILLSGPTGTAYYAWLVKEGKDGMYKMTDRSLCKLFEYKIYSDERNILH